VLTHCGPTTKGRSLKDISDYIKGCAINTDGTRPMYSLLSSIATVDIIAFNRAISAKRLGLITKAVG
jgi:hypothetical protein